MKSIKAMTIITDYEMFIMYRGVGNEEKMAE